MFSEETAKNRKPFWGCIWPFFRERGLLRQKIIITFFYQELGNGCFIIELYLTTTVVDGKYQHGKPLIIPTLFGVNFHAVWHSATCHSMQKLCQSWAALMSTLFSVFATWQTHFWLHSTPLRSVDALYEYADQHITCSSILIQRSLLNSKNSRMCRSS